jgi:uncharacterized protein YbjT (DUF2867 family)
MKSVRVGGDGAEMSWSCSIAGASGLIGGHLLAELLGDADVTSVTALVRRPLGVDAPKLHELRTDFEEPKALRPHLAVDAVFCCLGTTIGQAGSQEAFRRVDYLYPLTLATAAAASGAGQFLIVTAVGADAHSRVFYNRVKGELEQALRAISFPGGLHLFHPSLLLGHRARPRMGERLASALMGVTRPLLAGPLLRYRAIDASAVALAMRRVSRDPSPGVHVYEGESLFALTRP